MSKFILPKSADAMKVILILLLITFFDLPAFGQNNIKVDSLIMALEKVQHDTNRVNTLNSLSYQLFEISNYALAKKYADDALLLAEQIKYKKGIADSYNNIGSIFLMQGNYSEALKNYLASIKLNEEIGNKKGIAYSYNNIGNIYNHQGNYPEALKNHLASLKLQEEIGNKNGIATSYANIGNIYADQGNYPEALKNYLASLKLFEEIGNKNGIAASYSNIGRIYHYQGNYPEALKNYLASLKLFEEIGNKYGIASLYNNIGGIYKNQGNYPEALKNHLASLKLQEEIGNKHGIATSYINIGNNYRNQGNYPEALKYYLSSLKLNEEIGDKNGIAESYRCIGIIYTSQCNFPEALKNYLVALKISEEMGEKQTIANCYLFLGDLNTKLKNPFEAKKYLDDAVSLSLEVGSKLITLGAYQSLAALDSLMGNYDQALEHYKMYIVYKDSLADEGNAKLVAEMKTKYETENKDKEIQLLQSEQQISDLELTVRAESIYRIQSESDRIQLKNIFNLQQLDLLANQQELQQYELNQNQASLLIQKSDTERKQNQFNLLNKEHEIQKLALRKEKLTKSYLLTGIGLLALLSFVVYNNFITRQQLKLQTLRNKIASDLHDDVGSTLSSISIFSQMAQQQSKDVMPLLNTIGESSRKMLDAMADIVWTINPENDQFEKIILRMRSFAFELLGAKGIDFEFIADDQIAQVKLPMEVRKNLYLIFKEATNNMVKYSGADKALFSITEERGHLTMLIRDNGKGFDATQTTQGNGLKNMKKRAEEIRGHLWVDSALGEGTTIQLKIAV